MMNTITEDRYLLALDFLKAHDLDFYPSGVLRDTENNYLYQRAMNIILEYEEDERNRAAEEAWRAQARTPSVKKKKGQSWVPKGGKLESYYNDVKYAMEANDDDGLSELYSEALDKGNAFAQMKYLRIYNMLAGGRRHA